MITFISKTTPPFCHEWQRVRVLSRHRICTARASISIISILRSSSIIIIIIILILSLRSLWSRWRRSLKNKTTQDCLSSCNTVDTSVHLIQLSRKCIKVSIHALKLCHDVPESHTARRREGSRCGWSRTGGRSCWPRLPRPKLHLTPFNSSGIYGTHVGKVVGR